MGSQQSLPHPLQPPPQHLDSLLLSHLSQHHRLNLSHTANIYQLIHHLRTNQDKYQYRQLYLENDMVAEEVLKEISFIDFEEKEEKLKVLALSKDMKEYCRLSNGLEIVKSTLCIYYIQVIKGIYSTTRTDHNKIASDGCYYLAKSNLPRLQTLDLSHNLINDNGAGHLSNANLPSLVNLNISHNQLTYHGIVELSKAQWPSLAFLQATSNDFEPNKEMEKIKFRTQVKMFRIQLQ